MVVSGCLFEVTFWLVAWNEGFSVKPCFLDKYDFSGNIKVGFLGFRRQEAETNIVSLGFPMVDLSKILFLIARKLKRCVFIDFPAGINFFGLPEKGEDCCYSYRIAWTVYVRYLLRVWVSQLFGFPRSVKTPRR